MYACIEIWSDTVGKLKQKNYIELWEIMGSYCVDNPRSFTEYHN